MRIREIIADIKSLDTVLVAVSGGIDSMVLLNLVMASGVKFKVAHFDHRIRENSHVDADFIGMFCIKNNIDYVIGYGVDIVKNAKEDHLGIEAEARNQRYSFLNKEATKFGANYILTAHHESDQIETILMRLMKGYPHDALDMKQVSGMVYRPLLSVSRKDIENLAKKRNIAFVEDETNFDIRYDRNWVRHVLLPMMNERRNIYKTIPGGLRKTLGT